MKCYQVVLLCVVLLTLSCNVWCADRIQDGDPGTIGTAISQSDGTQVTLESEQVIWRGRSGKSFAIKEYFEVRPQQPRLVVISTHSLPVKDTYTVDITGTLSTVSGTSKDGSPITQRVIISSPENIKVYCDSKGRPMVYPPVKSAGTTEWPYKKTLSELSNLSSAGVSMMDINYPPLDDSPDSDPLPPAEGSRDGLKWLPDDTSVHLRNRLINGRIGYSFCIEEPDRTSSIRIGTNNTSPNTGNLVDIVGTLITKSGERYVQADTDGVTITESNCAIPRPLGMPNKSVCGGAVGMFTPGVGDAVGPNNTGMLATVWGTVSGAYDSLQNATGDGYYCIDDGSGMQAHESYAGIRIYSVNWDDWPEDGNFRVVTGIIHCDQGYPSIWEVSNTYPTYSSGSGIISGTINSGTSAAGLTARIHSTCGSTTCLLDASGSGTYSLTAKPGNHTVSVDVAGYGHAAQKATVIDSQTTAKNFTLTSIGKGIYVYTNSARIAPDGISTTTATAVVFDEEGRRLPNQSVTWNVDLGTIVSSDSVTNIVGEAYLVVQSPTTADTANVSVTCDGITKYTYIEYASPTAPTVKIVTPTPNQILSGSVTITVKATDSQGIHPGILQVGIVCDGQPLCALAGGTSSTSWATYRLPNGTHTIKAAASDGDLEYGYSPTITVTTTNTISSVSITNSMFDLSDTDPTKRFCMISAQQPEPTDWQIEITKVGASSATKVFTGTGTVINATWDGTDGAGNTALPGRYKYTISRVAQVSSMSTYDPTLWDYIVFLNTQTGLPTALLVEGNVFSNNPECLNTVETACEDKGFQVITIDQAHANWDRFEFYMNAFQPKVLYVVSHGSYEIRTSDDCKPDRLPQISQFKLNDCWVYSYRPKDNSGNYYPEYPASGQAAYANIPANPQNIWPGMSAHYVSELGLTIYSPLKLVWMDTCLCGRIGSLLGDTSSSTNPYQVDAYSSGNDLASMFGIYDNAYTIGASYCGFYELSFADDRYAGFLGRIFSSMASGYTLDAAITRDAWGDGSKYRSLYPGGIDSQYGPSTYVDDDDVVNWCFNWRVPMPPYHNLRVHGNPYCTYLSPY